MGKAGKVKDKFIFLDSQETISLKRNAGASWQGVQMRTKQKPSMVTSPFAHSITGTLQKQGDISNLRPSSEPEQEDVSPLNDVHADLGRRLQARRSLSSPDLASLAAEPEQNVEHAPFPSFQAGKQPAHLHMTRCLIE